VIRAFPDALVTKTRPAVLLSREESHLHRSDLIVGQLTPTNCQLLFWKQAGLHTASYFRLFPVTLPQRAVRRIGQLSDLD
jgi:hypothetical protein